MNIKETKKNIIQAGHKAVEELIKVAREEIVDSDEDISADRLKNAAATKKLAIFDAFEILNRIHEEENMLEDKPAEEEKKSGPSAPYLFEPSEEELLDVVLPRLSDIVLFQGLLESRASEHSSRRVAMKNASENAGKLVDELELSYNRARQASITQEIAEIASGAEL